MIECFTLFAYRSIHLITRSLFFFKDTTILPYKKPNGEIVNIQSIQYRGNFPLITIDELNARVLMLPYGDDNRLSMLILLPKIKKLNGIFTRLKDYTLEKLLEKMDENVFKKQNMSVAMPMTNINTNIDLRFILKIMGIQNILDREQMGYETGIFHKAKIEFHKIDHNKEEHRNEQPDVMKLVLSDPFAYVIIECHTQIILIAGQVKNPLDK